ncbi:MAG: hypothetical protein ACOYOJ_17380 [Alsobacter sp.]
MRLAKGVLKTGIVAAGVAIVLKGTPLDPMDLRLRGAATQSMATLSTQDIINRAERLAAALPQPRGLEPVTDRMPNTALFAPVSFRLSQIQLPSRFTEAPIRLFPQTQFPSVSAVQATVKSTVESTTLRVTTMLR